jgi:hypothetical protein
MYDHALAYPAACSGGGGRAGKARKRISAPAVQVSRPVASCSPPPPTLRHTNPARPQPAFRRWRCGRNRTTRPDAGRTALGARPGRAERPMGAPGRPDGARRLATRRRRRGRRRQQQRRAAPRGRRGARRGAWRGGGRGGRRRRAQLVRRDRGDVEGGARARAARARARQRQRQRQRQRRGARRPPSPRDAGRARAVCFGATLSRP